MLPKDKYKLFVTLFRFPTPVIELTSKIYSQLERVFSGKNSVTHNDFKDTELQQDYLDYASKQLKFSEFWKTEAWEEVKTNINSVIVVDLPEVQNSFRPEPYFYFLKSDQIISFRHNVGIILSIIFSQDGDKVAILDEEYYRVVSIDGKNEITEVHSETPHGLTYCPAQFFWSDSVKRSEPAIKKNNLTPQLGNLDWLNYFCTGKKHLDLYASHPIYSGYESDCDFENVENGDFCDGGFLRNTNQDYKIDYNGSVAPCPVCSEKNLAGVGSFISIPSPKSKDDPDLRNPVQITTIDKDSLAYNTSEVERLEKKIEDSVVGTGSRAHETKAINSDQVLANSDAKTNVLQGLKRNIEKAMKFTNDTVCRLRYQDQFLGSYISLGNQFYSYTTEAIANQIKEAKENGASETQIAALNEELISSRYTDDPKKMQRLKILQNLEPYPYYTIKELIELKEKGVIDPNLFAIKINFTNFIDRFERENTDLVEFGSATTFDNKINIILKTLNGYVTEQTRESEEN